MPSPLHFGLVGCAIPNSVQGAESADEEDEALSLCSTSIAGSKRTIKNAPLCLTEDDIKQNSSCKGCGSFPSEGVQWFEYIPIYGEIDGENEILGKRPKGRKCYLCTATYRTAGWHHMYDTIGHYFKFACTPAGRSKHQEFLKKRKALAQRLDEETASGYGVNALKAQLTVGERKSMRTEVRAAGRTELH